jgi:hypothetical protein
MFEPLEHATEDLCEYTATAGDTAQQIYYLTEGRHSQISGMRRQISRFMRHRFMAAQREGGPVRNPGLEISRKDSQKYI